MRSTWTPWLLLLTLSAGCNSDCDDCASSVNGSTDSTCTANCDSDSSSNGPTASAIVTTSIDGEQVSCDAYIYAETVTDDGFGSEIIETGALLTSGATGETIGGIPADVGVQVMVGNDTERDCDNRPLHVEGVDAGGEAAVVPGNLWTYDTVRKTFPESDAPTEIDVQLGQYLLGWFECSYHGWSWNDETWEYDIDHGETVLDPILVTMHGTTIRTTSSNVADGDRGTFRTSGTSISYTPEEGDEDYSIEEGNYATATGFGYVMVREEVARVMVTCELKEAATCDEE